MNRSWAGQPRPRFFISISKSEHRIDFDLDQHIGIDQAFDLDQCADRPRSTEHASDLVGDSRPVGDVGEKAIADHIIRRRSAWSNPPNVFQYLSGLSGGVADAYELAILSSHQHRRLAGCHRRGRSRVRGTRPIGTLVEVKGLINPDMLVEIEVDACSDLLIEMKNRGEG